mmetsp:Transcript_7198/g.15207  ORF Transcript_7198/g.15207 Transcript_7198/m.15207 type:complete len:242 (+) Transcript_7198:1408-2133(+)
MLLCHRQHLDQRGRRPGEVQRALHHLHERSHLLGKSQPPAGGSARGQLLWSGHLAAEETDGTQHELLRQPRHEVPSPEQSGCRQGEPGPRSGQLPGAFLAPLQHQHLGRLPLPRRAGQRHSSCHADEPPPLPDDHSNLGGLCAAPRLRRLRLGLLVPLLGRAGQSALQWINPPQQRLLLHHGHALVHGTHRPAASLQTAIPDSRDPLASSRSETAWRSRGQAVLLHERAGAGGRSLHGHRR